MSKKISGVIITLNEEKNLERCISSMKGVVDEIIVIDSFSTDRTKEIAINGGARFIENAFQGHIQQKNFALTQCESDYILSLDADEALSEELRQEILDVKNEWEGDGYYMPRLSNYCGKWIRHCGWYPDKKIRLFNRKKASWGGVNPHDKIIMEGETQLSHLKGDILHYTVTSIEEHIAQFNSFTTIGAKMAFGRGKRSTIFLIIFSPLFKFFKSYFIQKGFLDGYYGFIVCSISSFASFTKYVKLKRIQDTERHRK